MFGNIEKRFNGYFSLSFCKLTLTLPLLNPLLFFSCLP